MADAPYLCHPPVSPVSDGASDQLHPLVEPQPSQM